MTQREGGVIHFAFGAMIGAIAGALFASGIFLVLYRLGLYQLLGISRIDSWEAGLHYAFGGMIFGGLGGAMTGGIASPPWGLVVGTLSILIFGYIRLDGYFKHPLRSTFVLGTAFVISGAFGMLIGLVEHKLKIIRGCRSDPWDDYRRPGQRIGSTARSSREEN